VVLRQGKVLVTEAQGADDIETVEAYRACLAPRRPQLIDLGGSSGGGGGVTTKIGLFTSFGTRLAWAETSAPHAPGEPFSTPTIRLRNLGASTPTTTTIYASPGPAPRDQTGLVLSLAVGGAGTVVWVVDPSGNAATPKSPAILYAQRIGGQAVALDYAPSAALSGLAVSADGRAVAWTDGGMSRNAHLD